MIAPASLPDTESSPFVRSIGDVGCRDLRVAGCHGASLCELLEAGLPVAPGFVVTAQAFMFAMEHAGVAAMLRDGVRHNQKTARACRTLAGCAKRVQRNVDAGRLASADGADFLSAADQIMATMACPL